MRKRVVCFLVLPQVQLLDFAGPQQVFVEAMDYGANVDLKYCGLGGGSFLSVGNFPMKDLPVYDSINLTKGDILIIPGSTVDYFLSDELRSQTALFDWVRSAHERGVTVCSICTGAFFLAQTGLLDHLSCTTHWKRTAQLQTLFPKLRVNDNLLYIEDNGIYTSAGVTAGIDLALYLVSKMLGDHVSFKVARELVVYKRRSGVEDQQSIFLRFRNHIHTGVHRVQDYLQESIEQGASLTVLSEIACMSSRNLTRTFKKETGVTVNEFVNIVRVEKLRELVKNPDYTRKQLAHFCGLKSERQVLRLLKSA